MLPRNAIDAQRHRGNRSGQPLRATHHRVSYCFAWIHCISYTLQVMHSTVSLRVTRHSTDLPMARPARRRAGLPAALALLLLGGCAGGFGSSQSEGQAVAAAPVPADPLSAWVAQSGPGGASSVVLSDGRPATVRVARAYYAASGRECREVLVGTGTLQRAQLYCQAEGGGWVQARPLLRGGGVPRP
jgi:hypothetical protein